ncbi:hypothetical protein PCE1_001761 [Barthelona sp. PCE]
MVKVATNGRTGSSQLASCIVIIFASIFFGISIPRIIFALFGNSILFPVGAFIMICVVIFLYKKIDSLFDPKTLEKNKDMLSHSNLGVSVCFAAGILFVALVFCVLKHNYGSFRQELNSSIWNVFIIPLYEEIIYRGFVFRVVSYQFEWRQAAAISSLAFALSHLSDYQQWSILFYSSFYAMCMGLFLCRVMSSMLIRFKSKAVFCPMIIHVFYNAIASFSGQYNGTVETTHMTILSVTAHIILAIVSLL